MRLGRLALGALRLLLAMLDAALAPVRTIEDAEARRAEKRRRDALAAANKAARGGRK